MCSTKKTVIVSRLPFVLPVKSRFISLHPIKTHEGLEKYAGVRIRNIDSYSRTFVGKKPVSDFINSLYA